ncbi:MAG: DUF58 domain-containing protein [Solirubrobacteraceae bacterium]
MRRAAAVAIAGAALLLAAFTFDSSTLFVPAVALLVLPGLVSAWIWLAGRGAHISRTLDADRVVEDQPVEARIHLTGWIGLPGAEIRDALSDGSIAISSSATSRRIELRVLSRFPTRGRVVLPAPRLRLGDQLGLAETISPASPHHQELLVLPRIERIRWRGPEARAGLLTPGCEISPEPTGISELDGLRRYRPGTPASRIHWPALAKGAGLLERRLLAEGESSPLVVLDARGSGPAELLDAAVRAAASLTAELAGREGCDLLLPGQRRALHVGRELSGWALAHARLALVEGGPQSPAPVLGPRRRSAIFYVAAQPLRRPPPGTVEGRGRMIMVLPRELAGVTRQPVSFEVSGCVGVPAGERVGAEVAA